MMKVTFVSHSANLAGAERSMLELIRGLVTMGVACSVVVPHAGPIEDVLAEWGVPTSVSPYQWWVTPRNQARSISPFDAGTYEETSRLLATVLSRHSPDLVVTNTSVFCEGAFASRMCGIPHVWHVRELGERDHGFVFRHGVDQVARVMNETSAAVIFNARAVEQEFAPWIVPRRRRVIYNAVRIDDALLSQPLPEHLKPVHRYRLLVATAIISRRKGQLDALRALAHIIERGDLDCELVLLGTCRDQKLQSEIVETIRRHDLGDRVLFHEFLDNPYPVLLSADCVLVCSLNEALSRVMLESMALGRPVIATNKGGIPEVMIGGTNGLLYEPGDAKGLADSITTVLTDQGVRCEIISGGRHTALQELTPEQYSGEVLRVFTRVVEDARSAR